MQKMKTSNKQIFLRVYAEVGMNQWTFFSLTFDCEKRFLNVFVSTDESGWLEKATQSWANKPSFPTSLLDNQLFCSSERRKHESRRVVLSFPPERNENEDRDLDRYAAFRIWNEVECRRKRDTPDWSIDTNLDCSLVNTDNAFIKAILSRIVQDFIKRFLNWVK